MVSGFNVGVGVGVEVEVEVAVGMLVGVAVAAGAGVLIGAGEAAAKLATAVGDGPLHALTISTASINPRPMSFMVIPFLILTILHLVSRA